VGSEDDVGTRRDSGAPAVTAPMTGAPGTPDPDPALLDQDVMVGTVLGGRYEVGERLGAGGMGVVYAARDRLLEMPVALKFVRGALARDAGERSRLWKEVRLAQTITHPNVVRTFTLERQDGHLFIVMELLDGCALADRLRQGPLPVAEVVRIATSILTGLAAAHDRNIIHRDIKPENTRLCGDGRVVLMDFGIAHAQLDAAPVGAQAQPGSGRQTVLAGTPGYMAPEVVAGARATAVSDLYSVGVVLRDMLTGRDVTGPAAIPDGLAAVLARLLEPEPARRYRSAQEALDGLAASAPGGIAGPSRRRRWPVLGALGALGAAGLAAATWTPDRAAAPLAAAPSLSSMIDAARRRWSGGAISVCWASEVAAEERSWVEDVLRGPASWTARADVELVGWRTCDQAPGAIRIVAGQTMAAPDGAGDGVARVELDLGAAPERTWARCVAGGLDRKACIQAEALHLVGLVLGFRGAPDRPQLSCRASEAAGAGDTRSIVSRCGAARWLRPLDLAAAQAVHGIKDEVGRGNLAVVRDDGGRPELLAFLVDAAGHLRIASPVRGSSRWQWTDAGGPAGWAGRFTTVTPAGDGMRRGVRAFGISARGRLHEYDATGPVAVWHDRGGPGDLVGSPTAVTYRGDDGLARVHVFATSASRRLHEYTDGEHGGTWRDHGRDGVAGGPTAVTYLDRDAVRHVSVFVRDDRGALLERAWDTRAWTWIDRAGPVKFVGTPAVTTAVRPHGARYFHVAIIGADGHLYSLWTSWSPRYPAWYWDQQAGSGTLVGSPTIVAGTDDQGGVRYNVFAINADGRLQDFFWSAIRWAWVDDGSPRNLVAGPAALVHVDADERDRTDVLVVDRDGRLNHMAWSPSVVEKWTVVDGPRLAPIVW
jgi:hypothetical protein